MIRTYEKKERLLTVKDLAVAYGDKLIVRDINLAVDNIVRPNMSQGQVVALLGPSGVGKTQLFRCMAGLQQPTKGNVSLNGAEVPVTAGQVGVVFQSYPLLKHRTIMDNLKIAHKGPVDVIKAHLERFGMADKAGLYPAQLSGGQKQRVAIIQQLLCSTHFLLMDEPFSGLDIKMKGEVCKVLSEVSVADELNTLIVTTHDIDTAIQIADTIWIMGWEKDAEGKRIPGATCIKQIDLIERGLAWDPDNYKLPEFVKTSHEIRAIFEAN